MEFGSEFVYLPPAADLAEKMSEELDVFTVRETDEVVISDESDDDDGETCLLNILDTAGQEEYSAMREHYTRTGDGFVIIYSITDPSSFQEAEAIYMWLRRFKDQGSLFAILCGNKTDLEASRQVTTEQGKQLADRLGVPFCEASAKTGENVVDVFKTLLRTIPRTGINYKIVMLGSGAVGKSSITLRFTQNSFMSCYDPTIEDSYCKMITLTGLPKADKQSKKSKSMLLRHLKMSAKRDRPSSAASSIPQPMPSRPKTKGFFSSLRRIISTRRKSMPDIPRAAQRQQQQNPSNQNEMEEADVSTRTAQYKKMDGNVVLVMVGRLREEPNLLTGDPVKCGQCQAVLSSTSTLTAEPQGNTKTWICEFCGFLNPNLDIEEEEIPKGSSFDFMLAPAPSPETSGGATAEGPQEAQDLKKMAGYVVYCIDVSGSMGSSCQIPDFQAAWRVERTRGQSSVNNVSRLECIKEAVQRQVEQLHVDQPQKRALVVEFGSDVKVVGGGVMREGGRSLFSNLTSLNFAQLVQMGVQLADQYQLKPLEESFTQLHADVGRLITTGSTALGPALSICLGYVGLVPNSEIILCTDGMPNHGIGNLSGNGEGADFYRMVGDYAKQQRTVINILGVAGEQVGMPQVQVAADRSGGTVNILNPLEVVRQLRQIMQNPIVASCVTLTCYLHPDFVFDEPGYPDNTNRICKELGNVLKNDNLTFRFKPRLTTSPPALDSVPFQIQLSYTRLDGMQCLRVLSQSNQATTDRTQMEKGINVSVLGTAAVKKTAALAQAGNLKEANVHLQSVKRLAKRGASTVEQKEDLCAFQSECQDLDEELRSNTAQWNAAPAEKQETRTTMLHFMTNISHSRMQNASKKTELCSTRMASAVATKTYYSYQY